MQKHYGPNIDDLLDHAGYTQHRILNCWPTTAKVLTTTVNGLVGALFITEIAKNTTIEPVTQKKTASDPRKAVVSKWNSFELKI